MGRTVLIVDDHAGFRAAARSLAIAAGLEVVGEAADAVGALSAAEVLRPRIVLLDIQLPDRSGFDVARILLEDDDPPDVILVSSRSASDYGRRIERSGAQAFVSKADLSVSALSAFVKGT